MRIAICSVCSTCCSYAKRHLPFRLSVDSFVTVVLLFFFPYLNYYYETCFQVHVAACSHVRFQTYITTGSVVRLVGSHFASEFSFSKWITHFSWPGCHLQESEWADLWDWIIKWSWGIHQNMSTFPLTKCFSPLTFVSNVAMCPTKLT